MQNIRPNASHLTLITGGNQPRSPLMTIPSVVIARSIRPDGSVVPYRTSLENVRQHVAVGRYQPILDFWGCVVGQTPPINNLALRCRALGVPDEMLGIAHAHACFRGLKRPFANDNRGSDHIALISKPSWAFEKNADMVSFAAPYEVDKSLVFLTVIRLDASCNGSASWRYSGGGAPAGVITHWGFHEADEMDSSLPVDFANRFRRRLW